MDAYNILTAGVASIGDRIMTTSSSENIKHKRNCRGLAKVTTPEDRREATREDDEDEDDGPVEDEPVFDFS